MIRINIHEAKTHLSKYAQKVKAGETVILCDRNVPFGEIRPFETDAPGPVRFGVSPWEFAIPDDFDDPLESFESDFYRA